MEYKITIVSNFLDKDSKRVSSDLSDYISKNTELIPVISLVHSELEGIRHHEFTKLPDGRPVYGTTNGKDLVRSVVNEGSCHQVLFFYDLSRCEQSNSEQVTAWSFYNELYPGTEYTEMPGGRKTNNSWESRTSWHETLHAMVKNLKRKGISVTDHMDSTVVDGAITPYYHNDDPTHPDGNFSRTLRELAPHWESISSRESVADKMLQEIAKLSKKKTIVRYLEPLIRNSWEGSDIQSVVFHTLAGSVEGSYAWLDQIHLSYHEIIDTDGTLYKMIPLDRSAWHAGVKKNINKRAASFYGNNNPNRKSYGLAFARRGESKLTREQVARAVERLKEVGQETGTRFTWSNSFAHNEIHNGKPTEVVNYREQVMESLEGEKEPEVDVVTTTKVSLLIEIFKALQKLA